MVLRSGFYERNAIKNIGVRIKRKNFAKQGKTSKITHNIQESGLFENCGVLQFQNIQLFLNPLIFGEFKAPFVQKIVIFCRFDSC